MQSRVVCGMLLAGVLLRASSAQVGPCAQGRVVDDSGGTVPGAVVRGAITSHNGAPAADQTVVADQNGAFALSCPPGGSVGQLSIEAPGYASQVVSRSIARGPITVVLRPATLAETVNVTATRASVALGSPAETLDLLERSELLQYPGLTLDDALRQHAGFELFRRSSSWVANPTSQGISLRGLGSTAASRTLVLADGAPLNDPFGGWVHWNEFAPEAIESVTIATGGGSDLYGSSALGGVIDVTRRRTTDTFFTGTMSGAMLATTDGHGAAGLRQGRWSEQVSGQGFRTGGYVPVAPSSRGPVDRPANVHFQNAGIDVARSFRREDRAFLRGDLLNEARNNGTLLQTNGTRLWRWLAGDNWDAGAAMSGRLRFFGSNEGYRQTFSSINSLRSQEALTRTQGVRTSEVGASVDSEVHKRHVALVAGADLRDIRATNIEVPVAQGRPTSLEDTTARQRLLGGFGELLAIAGPWSFAASLRLDDARNFDATTRVTPQGAPPATAIYADRDEVVASPRVGLVRSFAHSTELHATAFRAFRTPTLNELYRTSQVGQQTTLANPQLRAERATGVEGGVAWRSTGEFLDLHGNYFWTAINRPVSAVLVASTPTAITNKRENLGQIVSQGMDAAVRVGGAGAISGTVEYQYANATVTSFSAAPALVGLWIPEVPRHTVTAQLRFARAPWGTLVLAERASGRAYDDSSNQFELRPFSELNLYADHTFRGGFEVFVSVQNALDQRADAARTPVLSLGTPATVEGGLRFSWPPASSR